MEGVFGVCWAGIREWMGLMGMVAGGGSSDTDIRRMGGREAEGCWRFEDQIRAAWQGKEMVGIRRMAAAVPSASRRLRLQDGPALVSLLLYC